MCKKDQLEKLYRQRQLIDSEIQQLEIDVNNEAVDNLKNHPVFKDFEWCLEFGYTHINKSFNSFRLVPVKSEGFDTVDCNVRDLLNVDYHGTYDISKFATIRFHDSDVSLSFMDVNRSFSHEEFVLEFKAFLKEFGIVLGVTRQEQCVNKVESTLQTEKDTLEQTRKFVNEINS